MKNSGNTKATNKCDYKPSNDDLGTLEIRVFVVPVFLACSY